jgi:uncharacterized protein (DUF1697 family)
MRVTTYIALLRGINVGGNTRLPMNELKALFETCGCADVQTYIQSGNVVLRAATADPVRLARQLAAAISTKYHFAPAVLMLTRRELERAAAQNPFTEAEPDPKSLHVFFLEQRPKKPDLKGMELLKSPTERFILKGTAFYLHAPDGIGRSKLAARAERLLGVAATARNWRTVTTLLEMAPRDRR